MGNERENLEILQTILEEFNINSDSYKDKSLHKAYVSLTTTFSDLDRVDAIASIIYDFTEEPYLGLIEFLGLNSESDEDYFSGFVEEIKRQQIGGVNSGEVFDENISQKFE